MEPAEAPIRLNEEAMETVKRILTHIIQPLYPPDRKAVIYHLCETFDVYRDDPLY